MPRALIFIRREPLRIAEGQGCEEGVDCGGRLPLVVEDLQPERTPRFRPPVGGEVHATPRVRKPEKLVVGTVFAAARPAVSRVGHAVLGVALIIFP